MISETFFLIPGPGGVSPVTRGSVNVFSEVTGFALLPSGLETDATADASVIGPDRISLASATADGREGSGGAGFLLAASDVFVETLIADGDAFATGQARTTAAFDLVPGETLSFDLGFLLEGTNGSGLTTDASLSVVVVDGAAGTTLLSIDVEVSAIGYVSPSILVDTSSADTPSLMGEVLIDVAEGVAANGTANFSVVGGGTVAFTAEEPVSVGIVLESSAIVASGSDPLIGALGDDVAYGTITDDWIEGRRVYASFGDDTLEGTTRDDVLEGGPGHDSLWGWLGDNSLSGGSGDDTIEAALGEDFLVGGSGADLLIGGNGADTLMGGEGDDTLTGGKRDAIRKSFLQQDLFDPGDGNNTLTDLRLSDGRREADRVVMGRGDDQEEIASISAFTDYLGALVAADTPGAGVYTDSAGEDLVVVYEMAEAGSAAQSDTFAGFFDDHEMAADAFFAAIGASVQVWSGEPADGSGLPAGMPMTEDASAAEALVLQLDLLGAPPDEGAADMPATLDDLFAG